MVIFAFFKKQTKKSPAISTLKKKKFSKSQTARKGEQRDARVSCLLFHLTAILQVEQTKPPPLSVRKKAASGSPAINFC